MAYDEILANRIRRVVDGKKGVSEQKMFGGLAFLHNGHMACGVAKEELMVRVGPDAYEEALALPHAREMDFTGRPMKGMIYVEFEGYRTDHGLEGWVERGLDFTGSLPPKKPKKKQAARKKTPPGPR